MTKRLTHVGLIVLILGCLLGLVAAHWDLKPDYQYEDWEKAHSGMSVITPVESTAPPNVVAVPVSPACCTKLAAFTVLFAVTLPAEVMVISPRTAGV